MTSYVRTWQKQNKDKLGEYRRDYKRRAYANDPEPYKEGARRWYVNNRERKRENNARYHRENRAGTDYWKSKDPAIARRAGALRRARKAAASITPFTANELAQRWSYYGDRCWICGGVATATDHVKPLAKGGAHALCNLRPICKPCNSSKGSRWPFDKSELLNRAA
ncbi:HNH endonuclease [Mycobacteroides chelonae]|uniref:HNH endonuclease n=1 Tax=Mycobacteroides chelonae TaxID=1774 RepID=UPI00096A45FC